MIEMLMGSSRVLLFVLIILLLVATWQRTHIGGFLLLAASFGADLVGGLLVNAWVRFGDASGPSLALVVQALPLVGLGLAALGCWHVYQAMKASPSASAGA